MSLLGIELGRGGARRAKLHHAVRLVFSGIVCSSKIVDFDTFLAGFALCSGAAAAAASI